MAKILAHINKKWKFNPMKMNMNKGVDITPTETYEYNRIEFIHLPEKIILMLVNEYLDLRSIQCLYDTGNKYLKKVIASGVRKCKLSLSNVATSKLLKTTFFKDIATNIQELDLSAVYDVDFAMFSAAVKRCKRLKILNVAYTNIRLEYIAKLNLQETCTGLKDVAVNFTYECILPANLLNSRNFVQNLETIHLIISVNNMLYPKLLFMLLEKSYLNTLKLTCSRKAMTPPIEEHRFVSKMFVFKRLYVHLLDWQQCDKCFPSLLTMPLLAMLDLTEYEFIIIYSPSLDTHTLFVSSLFINFFNEHFDVNVCCITKLDDVFDYDNYIPGNVAIMLWKKDVNRFDNIFFQNLFINIKRYFPRCPKSNDSTVLNTSNWFVFTPKMTKNKELNVNNTLGFVWDYNTLFKNKQHIQISFDFRHFVGIAVAINDNSQNLSKVTYLSLCGLAQYRSDLFDTIFRCCTILNTLNVESAVEASCWLALSESLELSASLKNLRLVDRKINYQTLFLAFCSCKSIEKIYIKENIVSKSEEETASNLLLLLFLKCRNLYNLDIEKQTKYGNYIIRYVPRFTKIETNGEVSMKRQPRSDKIMTQEIYTYNPYKDIFKLNPIRPI